MNPCHIWIRLKLPEEEYARLQTSVQGCEFRTGDDSSVDPGWLEKVEGIFTNEPLPDDLAERLPNLKWLHITRGGAYNFLTPPIRRRPIDVTTSKGIHGATFSEYGLAFILALAKKIPECLQAQTQKNWARIAPEPIEGKTLGIVGLGTVGCALAQRAKPLGLIVLATKRTIGTKPPYVDEIGPPEYLPTLLARSDYVVIAVPSIPATEGMLGEKELGSMKKTAYLINLTCGKATEEKLLVRALKEGWIAGAGLDAPPRQPLPKDSELWSLPNVIISPRIAGGSGQNWPLLLPIFRDNLKRFMNGEKLFNLLDKDIGY
jgi:phosphoglycerate dehydrogenase-like enzyme